MRASGKRSEIIAENKGRSSFKNFGTLASLMALINTLSSLSWGLALFNEPAITNTDFTALRPKS